MLTQTQFYSVIVVVVEIAFNFWCRKYGNKKKYHHYLHNVE